MVGRAAAAVNQALVVRNWLVGEFIVEYEQSGSARAGYGERLLERLAQDVKTRRIKGLDARVLRDCRLVYQAYPQIRGTLSRESKALTRRAQIRGMESGKSTARRHGGGRPTALTVALLGRLSWSKLALLARLDDPWKRAFYENGCLDGDWSVRQLERQVESLLYERTGLSRNKTSVIARVHAQESPETIDALIRDPYVLEFTGLAERPEYSESDLETALLDHLQRFLLELGSGFCFEARQFRITVNRKHDRVDLVFFHRKLRCHVLLELKIRAFRHADAGQMNFYVNWFKAQMMGKGDNPPVGIVLCSDKDHTEVEFATAGMNNKLFVSR